PSVARRDRHSSPTRRSSDLGLRSFGALMKKTLRVDVRKLEGAGAAGGLGAALVAFCGAQLRSGVDIVLEATRLADHIKGADLVIDRKSTRLNSSHVKISYAV